MNNFLTRLVTRSSTKLQAQTDRMPLVMPRIGTRFENQSGLSGDVYRSNEIEQQASATGEVQPVSGDTAQQPNSFSTDRRAMQTSEAVGDESPPLRVREMPTSTLENSERPVHDVPGSGVPDINQENHEHDGSSMPGAPPITRTTAVVIPELAPTVIQRDATLHGQGNDIGENTGKRAGHTQHPEPSQYQLPSILGETSSTIDAIEQPPAVPSLSSAARHNLSPEVSTQRVQKKTSVTRTGALVAETGSHEIVQSRPVSTNNAHPARAQQRSAPTLPGSQVTADRFSATAIPDQGVKQAIPGKRAEQEFSEVCDSIEAPLTSVTDRQINLIRSRESADRFAELSQPGKPDPSIIRTTDLDSHGGGRAVENPLPGFSPHAPAGGSVQHATVNVPEPATVKVSIGRIEIRSAAPAPQYVAPAQHPRRGPAISLHDYLKNKGGQE